MIETLARLLCWIGRHECAAVAIVGGLVLAYLCLVDFLRLGRQP